MGFVVDWQKKLGYARDPFAPPSERVSEYIIGRDHEREQLNLFIIKSARLGIVSGKQGTGKTTLLTWLAEKLRGNTRAVFIDAKTAASKQRFFSAVLEPNLNIVERTVTKPQERLKQHELKELLLQRIGKRGLVIIVDDATGLLEPNKELLKEIIKKCMKAQVILGLEHAIKEYGEDELKIELGPFGEATLAAILQKRIELVGGQGTWPFEGEELDRLVRKAKGNPVSLLKLGKQRAMELSLKVAGPPKKEKKEAPPSEKELQEEEAQLPKIATSPPEKKGKKSWFGIKVVKGKEREEEKAVIPEQQKSPKETAPVPGDDVDESLELVPRSSEAKADAEALSELIAPPTEHEIVIEDNHPGREIVIEDAIDMIVKESKADEPEKAMKKKQTKKAKKPVKKPAKKTSNKTERK